MAKKLPKGQVNKRNRDTLEALVNLMKDIDQKYSIKVGIIGDKARQKHPDSDLTNAELGAIHEFGCTINVTEKMRHFFYKKWGIQKSNNPVIIPTRSFLRMPLLSGEFKEYLMDIIRKKAFMIYDMDALGKDKEGKKLVRELNLEHAREVLTQNAGIIESIAKVIASESLARVQMAFMSSGFGKWAPISELTKASRKNDKSSPPLQDSGELMKSITAEVERVK